MSNESDLYAEMVQLVKASGCVACPKCALRAESLLHRFCQHDLCPIRDAFGNKKIGGMLEQPSMSNDSQTINDPMVPGEQLRIVIEQRDSALAERDMWQARAMALFWQGVVDDATYAEIRKATDECSAWLASKRPEA